MTINPRLETEHDIQLVKDYTLLPILLDMLARDIEELTLYKDKIVYHHVISYLKGVEQTIHEKLYSLKNQMRKQHITILNTETNALGIEVEYKVRGYIHQFHMLRSLVKAELLTMLMNIRRRDT
ncbi:hypothetical protein [Paenibacillus rigui]|uniref:Uncharacterized protein n=1 Tax=Paenibacillus rigui TaxID=554312 RepID=A0A229UR08_9BACL|nr:hypothetical protein [Paenibacillus rigui]OXM85838.1 hypothetical protein CF651_11415 [Paenibacillus rigui]